MIEEGNFSKIALRASIGESKCDTKKCSLPSYQADLQNISRYTIGRTQTGSQVTSRFLTESKSLTRYANAPPQR